MLAGDTLIVLAFETLAQGLAAAPHRLGALVSSSVAGSAPGGIAAGQAWECESPVALTIITAKTGALFGGATVAGATAAGADQGPGAISATGSAKPIRSPTTLGRSPRPGGNGQTGGRDAALGRPTAAGELGLEGAVPRSTS